MSHRFVEKTKEADQKKTDTVSLRDSNCYDVSIVICPPAWRQGNDVSCHGVAFFFLFVPFFD